MDKFFNVEGICFPDIHYMVNLESRITKIEEMVDMKKYFTINRARQYGKTTTLEMLKNHLEEKYSVFFISLEGMDDKAFEDAGSFCCYFCGLLYDAINYGEVPDIPDGIAAMLQEYSTEESGRHNFRDLGNLISAMCRDLGKPVVLIVDETDQAGNYSVFIKFLGMLRDKYLKRQKRPTFHSVILAGVYDIKNLKNKIQPDTMYQYNSPWNIAAEFNIDMGFSPEDIRQMLSDYENNCHTGMDMDLIPEIIYEYTSGYPYIVSGICKLLDEKIPLREGWDKSRSWTREGVLEAVKLFLNEPGTLFDDIRKKLEDFPGLRDLLDKLLFNGSHIPYNQYNKLLDIGIMFGFLKEKNGAAVVSNRIFEIFFYNLFISEQALDSVLYQAGESDKNQFIRNNVLDMDLVLEKFTEHFTEIYYGSNDKFVEENGRRLFLLYLKPIINGSGNYYIEAQTRNKKRTDIIVDYHGKQYIIELKIWHGEEYNSRGEKQLADYLEVYNTKHGYMISFNFNKNKKTGVQRIIFDDKVITEAVV